MIRLKTKVQLIYYQVDENTLGQYYTNSPGRVTQDQAKKILEEHGIEFKTVLKVKYRNIEMELTDSDIKQAITRANQNN